MAHYTMKIQSHEKRKYEEHIIHGSAHVIGKVVTHRRIKGLTVEITNT